MGEIKKKNKFSKKKKNQINLVKRKKNQKNEDQNYYKNKKNVLIEG
jgi:hypothetical protein